MIKKLNNIQVLQSDSKLFPSSKIVHAYTTAYGGISHDQYKGLNLSYHVGDVDTNVKANRMMLTEAFGFQENQLFIGEQVHEAHVVCVNEHTNSNDLQCTDALITNTKGVLLGVLAADCMPILIYDPKHNAVAAIHAGWKGTVKKIVRNVLKAMNANFGTQAIDCSVLIGPSIAQNDFEVGEEVAKKFRSQFVWADQYIQYNQHQKPCIDLWGITQAYLVELGVPLSQIEIIGISTFTNANFYSARRDGFQSGRFAGVIGLI